MQCQVDKNEHLIFKLNIDSKASDSDAAKKSSEIILLMKEQLGSGLLDSMKETLIWAIPPVHRTFGFGHTHCDSGAQLVILTTPNSQDTALTNKRLPPISVIIEWHARCRARELARKLLWLEASKILWTRHQTNHFWVDYILFERRRLPIVSVVSSRAFVWGILNRQLGPELADWQP